MGNPGSIDFENHWKPVWACFDCRKAVKLPEPNPDHWNRIRVCGSCGNLTLYYMGWDWKAPRKRQVKKWEKLREKHRKIFE